MRAEVDALFGQFALLLGRQDYDQLSKIQKTVILKRLLDISKLVHDFWNTKGGTIASVSEALQTEIKTEKNRTEQLVESAQQHTILLQDLERITAKNDAEQAKQGNLNPRIQQLQANYERIFKENQQKEQQIAQLKQDYQQLVDKLEAMQHSFEPMQKAHQANIKVFEAHFAENKAIWGDMEDNTTPQQRVNGLVNILEAQLKEFDNGLKSIMEQKDKLEISKIK